MMAVAVTGADFFAPPPSYYSTPRLLCCSMLLSYLSHGADSSALPPLITPHHCPALIAQSLHYCVAPVASMLEFLTTVLLWTALWLHSSSQSQPLSLLVTPVLSSFITPIGETSCWSPPPLNIVRSPTYPSPI